MSSNKGQKAAEGVQAPKKKAAIPAGMDWNKVQPVEAVTPRVAPMHSLIAPAIVDNLPGVLKEGVLRLVDDNDKLVFLVSALGILSGVLPNVKGHYGGHWMSANLYVFIVGGFGAGKGAMSYARMLVSGIEEQMEAKNKAEIEKYNNLEKEEKEKATLEIKDLVLPANITSSMFIQKLEENDGRAILYATEGDELAGQSKTEHGNYTAALRALFHHEQLGMMRRTDNERRSVKNGALSVVISGTPDQLLRIIPDALNGLFSRFLYLTIEAEAGWRNPFDKTKSSYEEEFKKLSTKVSKMYNDLLQRIAPRGDADAPSHTRPVEFTFTPKQQQQFNDYYEAQKPNFINDTGKESAGVYHRLALINFRVAMVLACLREYSIFESISDELVCTDVDYKTAKAITDILTNETKRIYYTMPEQSGDNFDEQLHLKANDCFWYKQQGLSVRKIGGLVGLGKSTVGRILNGAKPETLTKPIEPEKR